jgi:hypothetical protein
LINKRLKGGEKPDAAHLHVGLSVKQFMQLVKVSEGLFA